MHLHLHTPNFIEPTYWISDGYAIYSVGQIASSNARKMRTISAKAFEIFI